MKESFDKLFNTNPKYSTILATILGLILIDNLTSNEQDMLGGWLMLVSQTIVTNANSQKLIESRILKNSININSKELKSIYNPFIYDIDKIRDIILKLYPNELINIKDLSNYLEEVKKKLDKIKID
jgi:hypothetical protein